MACTCERHHDQPEPCDCICHRTLGADFRMLPEQQLQAIVTNLAAIKNPAQRTALAMELLGRSGAALIPLGSGLTD